jgi:large-conductance mechanosensitive channel
MSLIAAPVQASQQFTQGLKDWIIQNNILVTAATVTTAFSTGTFIRSFVADIVFPCLYALIFSRLSVLGGVFKPISGANIDNFLKELFQWILVIISTFLLIGYAFKAYVYSGQKEKHVAAPAVPTAPAPPPAPPTNQNSNVAGATTGGGEGFTNSWPNYNKYY